MNEMFGWLFITAWFAYWGYVLATNPEAFFRFQREGDERVKSALKGAGKAALFGFKLWRR